MTLSKIFITTLLLIVTTSSARMPAPPEVKADSNVPGFDVQVVLGLGRDSNFDLPYPMAVKVKNSSGKSFDGNMVIAFYSNEHVPAVRIPVKLPDNSHKVYRLCFPLKDYMSLKISFVDSGKVFWEGKAVPQARDQADNNNFNLLTIDSRGRKLAIIRSSGGKNPMDQYNTIFDRATVAPNCEAVAAWALPEHDAPLYSFDGLLFSNQSQSETLTAPQLKALGKYLVGGGSIVVPLERSNLRERVLSNLPFNVTWAPTNIDGNLQKQVVGKGLLITYDGTFYPITDASGNTLNNPLQSSLVELISRMPQTNFPGTIAANYNSYHRDMSTRGAISILIVIGMFLLYTIIIGPFTFLFRKSKRKMAMFLGLSISSFIGLSIVCGIFLRHRKGDIDWMSVTELTPHGAIQTAGITLRSCAGQRHDLEFFPEATEMRMYKKDPTYSYRRYSYQFDNYENERANASFPVMPTEAKDLNELEVPLAPWGQGHVLARNYIPELKPLKLNLNVTLPDPPSQTSSASPPGSKTRKRRSPPIGNLGAFAEGTLMNTLQVPVEDAEVVFQLYSAHINQYGYNSSAPYINTVAFISVKLGTILPGQTHSFKQSLRHAQQFNYYNRSSRVRWEYDKDKGTVALLLPKLNQRHRMHVTVVGRIKESPSIKEGDSDFITGNTSHFIIQSLPAEEMPDVSGCIIDAAKVSGNQPNNPNLGGQW